MSRVGRKPILIPNGVDASVNGSLVSVKGPKGELTCLLSPLVQVVLGQEDDQKIMSVTVGNELDKKERSQWGTTRALLQNMIIGTTEGFSEKLEVNGVGYKVNMQGKNLVLNVGYSHPVPFNIPEGMEASVEANVITLRGIDKQLVGEMAARIRKIRKPEPYKGKGIKYIDEVIRRKAGKAQKSGE